MPFKKVDPKQSLPKMEEEILAFWEENKIFEKSLQNSRGKNPYVFYDGPPFATGSPHYGHIVASTMKDVVPRFWTMRGHYVERVWGWDCHGLPIENIAEKELGIKRKTEIEEMGVAKFNEFCRSKVLEYVEEWKKTIRRLGRWADMENAYKTMDLPYMESVWWVFKELWKKGLIYEGYRSMHICTRCETTLSQQEIAEGYKDIKDLSVTVKFKLLANKSKLKANENEYLLAWTTTPWTLIGNVALAVGENIDYVKIKCHSELVEESNLKNILDPSTSSAADFAQDDDFYILAKNRVDDILKDKKYEIINEFKGKKLIGKDYKPFFDYYVNKGLDNEENGWKIYPADFVTTEEGTGIVHIAPAFGEDDLNLSYKYNLPFIQHVGMDGLIKKEAEDFAGLSVKPMEDHQKTDIEVIKYLTKNNLLFSKEQYQHSYPHCWRCETPLINYATSSWFVNITKIKDEALKLAEDINWSPSHIKEGRFGNWLEGARDWSISRQRFWASVVPIWKCDKCNEIKVIGSINDLKEQFGNPNKLFLVRHGEAENNEQNILSSYPEKKNYGLIEKGKKQISAIAKVLKDNNIKVIFSSPLQRAKETAQIISEALGIEIIIDNRLRETDVGKFNGESGDNWGVVVNVQLSKKNEYGVENFSMLRNRIQEFLNELNEKFKNENIVVVSHGDPLRMLQGICDNIDDKEIAKRKYPQRGKMYQTYSRYIDLHKHIVDKITFPCDKCKGEMKRIPDVLDTWFDSGSMPYAQIHYPFENREKFEKGFPAQFIAEGVDQTRAWFYYLHIISTAIKNSRAYNNVIVNGIVLAEDGKKMSKRLKNYPDPDEIMEKYGADALRFYLLSSPVMAAENLNFKESEVTELVRGMLRMLWNSYSFFVLYANIDKFQPAKSYKLKAKNLLDKWIISELNMLIKDINESMEKYELNRAVRFFPKFIDNLSNWYIRRSRRRFWKSESDEDKKQAYETLYHVLVELSKLLAPFTPFVAEEIYKNLTGEESVHLADFPAADKKLVDEKLNQNMNDLRQIVSLGLQERAKQGIRVRQPLSKFSIFNFQFSKEMIDIIKEELNVKEVIMDRKSEQELVLDTEISQDLRFEGIAREIIRHIQEMRKEAGYEVDNRIQVCYSGLSKVFEKFRKMIAKEILAEELTTKEIKSADLEREFNIEGEKVRIKIKKI